MIHKNEVVLTDSYLNNAPGKRYYHWLERAQLGQLECAVIKWPTLFQDNLFKNLIHETQYLQKHLVCELCAQNTLLP